MRIFEVNMDEASEDSKVREIMSITASRQALAVKQPKRVWSRLALPITSVIDHNGILRKDGSEGDPKIDLSSLESEITPLLMTRPVQRQP